MATARRWEFDGRVGRGPGQTHWAARSALQIKHGSMRWTKKGHAEDAEETGQFNAVYRCMTV